MPNPLIIFEFIDYRKFVVNRLKNLPKRGHGQFRRISEHLGMHTTAVSQVFRGIKDFTLEQGSDLCDYLELPDTEAEYFMSLLQWARAGTSRLRDRLHAQIRAAQERYQSISHRVPESSKLENEVLATFYSQWFYSGVRIASSLPNCRTPSSIATKLGLPLSVVEHVLRFLLQTGLCMNNEQGDVVVGPKNTHLDSKSPFIPRHHANWRLKAMENLGTTPAKEFLAYSGLMSLSKKDAARIRASLTDEIERTVEAVQPSPAEELYCLNLDWFRVG